MYKYKLKVDLQYVDPKKKTKSATKDKAPFGIPRNSLIKIKPDTAKKPLVNIGNKSGSNVEPGENIYRVQNGEVLVVESKLTPDMWNGFTYRLKKAGCGCKGYYQFKFNLLEIL